MQNNMQRNIGKTINFMSKDILTLEQQLRTMRRKLSGLVKEQNDIINRSTESIPVPQAKVLPMHVATTAPPSDEVVYDGRYDIHGRYNHPIHDVNAVKRASANLAQHTAARLARRAAAAGHIVCRDYPQYEQAA